MAPKNAVIKINYPGSGNSSQFTFDGDDNLVRILEFAGGSLSGTKLIVIAEDRPKEIRDAEKD